MANVKKISGIEMITNLIESALETAKEEYLIKPTNPLSSVIVDLELTIIELKKIKHDGLTA